MLHLCNMQELTPPTIEIGAKKSLSARLRDGQDKAGSREATQHFAQFTEGKKREGGSGGIQPAAGREAGSQFINDALRALVLEEFHAANGRLGWRSRRKVVTTS